ncbi:MAG TPA: hypothetical protein VNT99_08410 [Methylomirabilota bacterium]|nr:hypothetical protein [Methylomirabilota bacterium]
MAKYQKRNGAEKAAELFVANHLLANLKVLARNTVESDPPIAGAAVRKIQELKDEIEQRRQAA